MHLRALRWSLATAAGLGLLALALAAMPGASAATVYSQNFDGGSAPGWTLSGLWHTTTCQSASPSWSIGYNKPGCPTNYDTGVANSGFADAPVIAIPNDASQVRLTYSTRSQTECGATNPCASFDKRLVQISVNGGAFVTVMDEVDTGWTSRDITISGQVPPGSSLRVRFSFNTGDNVANNYEGWYVDNVAVHAEGPVPGTLLLTGSAGPGAGAITLSWTPTTGSPNVFKVYRGTSPGATTFFASTGGASYTDTGLGNGATFYYAVSGVNNNGEGPKSNEVSATTFTPPAAPAVLAAHTSGLTSITLEWSVPPNGGAAITAYQVLRGTCAGCEALHASIGPTVPSYTDSAAPGSTYYYKVRAVNIAGAGALSPGASASTATFDGPHTTVTPAYNGNLDQVYYKLGLRVTYGGSTYGTVLEDTYNGPLPYTTPAYPSGVVVGPDQDGDGFPSTLGLTMQTATLQPSGAITLAPAGNQSFTVDPDDQDPANPLGSGAGAAFSAGCAPDAFCAAAYAEVEALGSPPLNVSESETLSLDPTFDALEGAAGVRPVRVEQNGVVVARPTSAGATVPGATVPVTMLQSVTFGSTTLAYTEAGGVVLTTPSVSASGLVNAGAGSLTLSEPAPLPSLQAFVLGLTPSEATVPVPPVGVQT